MKSPVFKTHTIQGGSCKSVVRFLQSDDSRFRISSKKRLALFPGAEKAAKNNHLAEVICVVVGNEQGFAENRLSSAVRNSRKKICCWIHHQPFHRRKVAGKCFQTFLPRFCIRGFRAFGPVSGGPIGRDVFRIAREFENVPLRDPHVLQQFPRRMRQTLGPDSLKLGRNPGKCCFPIEVRATAGQKIRKMLS